jgi:leucyl aminopeptidase
VEPFVQSKEFKMPKKSSQTIKSTSDVIQTSLEQFKGDALAIGVFKDTKKVPASYSRLDSASAGAISRVLASGDFTGEANQVTTLYISDKLKFSRLILVGLGEENKADHNTFRLAAGTAARAAAKLKINNPGLALHAVLSDKKNLESLAQAMIEGAIYGCYNFQEYLTEQPARSGIQFTLIALEKADVASMKKGCFVGTAIADAQNYARALSNKPGNVINPQTFAKEAQRLAGEIKVKCTIFDDKKLAAKKMNAILAVGSGSATKPRLVILEYNGCRGSKKSSRPDAIIVGKGVTYDTGGLDIKPITGMLTMNHDKEGACEMLAVMMALSRLKLPLHVIGLAPLVENMLSGTSYRPNDIIRTYSGKTVEITSTDAEGRVILSDALTFGSEMKPKAMIDIATLTGGVVVALGAEYAGLFGNNDDLMQKVNVAAKKAGEPLWILPSGPGYLELMKSKVADLKNTGGRPGAPCTGAAFLKAFVTDDVPWVHLDIAAMDCAEEEKPWRGLGGTAFGVRIVMEYLLSL